MTQSVEDNAELLLGKLFLEGPDNVVAIPFAAAITLDEPNVASVQTVALTGNSTLTLPAPVAGAEFTLYLTQDATGSRLVTWAATSGAVKFSGGSHTVSTAVNAIDQVEFQSDGTNWYGNLLKAFA